MTGATGYLGSSILNSLFQHSQDLEITILKRSFSNTNRIAHLLNRVHAFNIDKCDLSEIFSRKKFDAIFHFATNYGRGQISSCDIIESNLLLPLRLLELGISNNVGVFLNTDTMLDKNVSGYSLSKRQFREWLQNASTNILALNIALEHFYGPGDDPTKFVSNVLHKLINGEASIPLTFGDQKRDFIFIEDVVSAFAFILKNTDAHSKGYVNYEVGSGTSISIKDFVNQAKEISGNISTILKFGAIAMRPNEPLDVQVNIEKLRALGWKPLWTLHDGLSATIYKEKGER